MIHSTGRYPGGVSQQPSHDQPNADPGADPTRSLPPAPWQLIISWLVLWLQGAAIIVGGLVWGFRSITDKPDNLGASLAGAVLCIVGGLIVIRLGVALRSQKQWARAPVIALEILFLPVGWALTFQGGDKLFGVPVLVVAALLIYLLLSKPVAALLDRVIEPDDD